MASEPGPTIEVFADVLCPFAYVGIDLARGRRNESTRRERPAFWIRAWPLEIINAAPFDPAVIADEVAALRASVAPGLFTGFDASNFPSTSQPAFELAAAAYRVDLATGEEMSVELRRELWERGRDISDPGVLASLASRFGIEVTDEDKRSIERDHTDGLARGVVGSPYFVAHGQGFFCPAFDVSHDQAGFHVRPVPERFDAFLAEAFSGPTP